MSFFLREILLQSTFQIYSQNLEIKLEINFKFIENY